MPQDRYEADVYFGKYWSFQAQAAGASVIKTFNYQKSRWLNFCLQIFKKCEVQAISY